MPSSDECQHEFEDEGDTGCPLLVCVKCDRELLEIEGSESYLMS